MAFLFVGICTDNDNDGYSAVEDCNDYNDTINPGANEITDDGIDQDCDGFDETTDSNGGGGNGNPTTEDCSNGIDDIRLLFDGDVRFLRQFK